jgi:hypothetical protein
MFAAVESTDQAPTADAPLLPTTGRSAASLTPPGWSRESETSGDLDRDGRPDLVLILVSPEGEHRVLAAGRGTPQGFRKIGEAALPPHPLQAAVVAINDRGVLSVEDLVGGATAIQTTYRFRYDAQSGRVRLVGLDAVHFSRAGLHDVTRVSINYATGERVDQLDKRLDDGTFEPQKARRRKGRSAVLYMENTPDPTTLLGLSPR